MNTVDYIEYKMLRTEIMQYLDNLQKVRNMMFIVTGTALGFGFQTKNLYLYFLPIVIIISSYLVSLDYWSGTLKACTYLQVFYEDNKHTILHWETRQQSLSKEMKPVFPNASAQHFPYWLSYIVSLFLYLYNIDFSDLSVLPLQLTLAILTLIIGIFIFTQYKHINRDTYLKAWIEVKNKETSLSNEVTPKS